MGQLSITVPRSLQRLTGKFILEVSFSVLVTLSAAQIASRLMAAPTAARDKVELRAEAPAPKPAEPPVQSSQAAPAADTDLSAFMEKAALAHVATARPDQIATPAPKPVSAAPAVWAAAQRHPRSSLANSVPARAPALPPAATPAPLPRVAVAPAPAVVAVVPDRASRPIPIIPAPAVVREHLATTAVPPRYEAPARPGYEPALRPPADLAPREEEPRHRLARGVDDVVEAPFRLVGGVADVGQSIGHSIGSLFHRF